MVTFEIAVTNEGTLTGTNIGITEFPDAGLNFSSAATSSNVTGTDTAYTILNLAGGLTETFSVSYTIDPDFEGDVLMNVVEITSDNGNDIDSDPDIRKDADDGLDSTGTGDDDGGNVGETDDDDEDMVMINVDRYDLSIQKANLSTGPFQPGDLLTFEITVVNEGSLDAANIGITEFPESGLVFDQLVGTNTNVTAVTASNYTIGSLPAGATETFSVVYQIASDFEGSSLMNVVEITSDDGDDIDSNPNIRKDTDDGLDGTATGDDDGGNVGEADDDDEDMVMIPINRYDLSIQKSIVNAGPFNPGDSIIFDLVVTNEGSLDASTIEVTEFPDNGLVFLAVDGVTSTNVSGTGPNYTIASLPAGATELIRVIYQIDGGFMGTQLMNIVEITADDGDDIDSNPDIRKDADDGLDGTATGDDDGGNVGETDDDDEDMVMIPVEQIFDLAIQKVIDTDITPGPYMAGDTVEFTITVTNQGTVDAFDIDIRDIPDAGLGQPTLTFAQPNVLPTGLPDVFTVDFVGAGQTLSFNVQSIIDVDFMGECLFNVAEIIGASDVDGGPDATDIDSTPDDNMAEDDDQDQAKVTVVQNFDLALIKVLDSIATPGPYSGGDRVEFTISVINQGSIDAFNIEVEDRNPAGLSSPTLVTQTGISQTGSGTYLISNIGAGSSFSFNVEAFIDEGFMDDCIVNVAEITDARDVAGTVRTDTDSSTSNDDGTEDDQDDAKINVGQVFDLALIKVLEPTDLRGTGPFEPGDDVRYTVTVFNQGTLNATNISVADMTPAGLSVPILVGGQAGVTGTGAGMFEIASLGAGMSFSFEIQAFIDQNFTGVQLLNDAEIVSAQNAANAPDIDSTPGNDATPDDLANDNDTADVNGGDDQDPALITVNQVFDLALRKVLSDGQASIIAPGEIVSFDIQVFNQGAVPATRIDVVDYVPAGLTLIQENGWTAVNGNGVTRNNDIIPGGLAPGGVTTVQIRFFADENVTGILENGAEIARGDNAFGIADCDSNADTNGGNDPLINDDIGTGCDVGNGDEDDHDVEPIRVEQFDLALRKTLAANQGRTVAIGDTVAFDITVFNQGSVVATRVDIVDYVPAGLTLIQENGWSALNVQDESRNNNIIPTGLPAGQMITVPIRFVVNGDIAGEVVNIAEIIRADNTLGVQDCDSTEDGNELNDTVIDDNIGTGCDTTNNDEDDHDIEPITVEAYDLSIQKDIITQGPFDLNQVVTFEITVTNEGDINASNVEVTDIPDNGLTFVGNAGSNTANVVPVAGSDFIYTITSLPAGTTETFRVIYRIDEDFQGDVLMNVVEITADDGFDIDSDPTIGKTVDDGLDGTAVGDDDGGNAGESDDDDEDMVMLEIGRDYDLAIDKQIVTQGPFELGGEVTFLITVTNEGQLDAANVGITDFPDAGFTFAGTDVGGNVNVTGTGNDYVILDLDAGQSEQFEVTYTINDDFAGNQLMNIVEITDDDGDDIDSDPDVRKDIDDLGDGVQDDDEDMVVIPLDVYDLSIQKDIVSQGPFDLGDQVTFTISVVNEGTLDAANIQVTDFPDTDLTFVSNNLPANVTGSLLQYVVASLPAGATETFDLTFQISDITTQIELMNIVEITADDGNDIDSDPSIRKDTDDGLDGTPNGDDDGGNVGETDDDDEDMVIIPIAPPAELCPCPDEEFIGQAVVTCSAGAFGNDDVAAILDLRPANLATPGDDWAAPETNGANVLDITNPTTWTIQQLGQIYGTSVGNTDGNIFFGASNVYAYDGDPFTPIALGPGGEQAIYATDFANPNNVQTLVTTSNNFIANPVGGTVVPGRFLDTNLADNPLPTGWGNIAYDEMTGVIYGSNLSDGRIYVINAASGVIEQVIDPFPAGGAGFLSDPYPADQVVWAIEINECTRQVFFIQQNVAGGGNDLPDGGPNRTKSLYTLDIDNATGMLSNQQLFQTINDGTREKITDIDFSTDCSRMLLGERGRVHNSGVYLYELNGAGNNFGLLTDVSIGSIDGGDPWEFGLNSSGGVAFGSDQVSTDAGICDTLIWAMADCLDPALVPGECNSYGPQGSYIPSGNITDLSGDLNATAIFADITPEFQLDPRFSKFGLGDIEIFSCCCPGIGNAASALESGQIAGAVIGPDDRGAVNFNVTLAGEESGYDVTDTEGLYGFESLEMNRSYTVSPSKVDHMVSGVTTLDLILIQNHILGTLEIEDPKLLIAADINGSGTINALDIIDLRRAILGLSYVTPTAEAWRFITADSEAMKGFSGTNYDEEYHFTSLEESQYGADFYAVKVGDVNNTLATAKSRNSNFQTLKLKKSQSSIHVNTPSDLDFRGMQMSIDLRGQELVDVTSDYIEISESNYNISEGILRISFHANSTVDIPADATILELQFAGRAGTVDLTDHINAETYNSDLRPSSFILTEDLSLEGYSLGQNNPNPTSGIATIDFVIPTAQTVQMHFYSLDGRLIGSLEQAYPAGRNTVTVDGELIQNSTGSIIYKMITDEFVATKNMIIVR